jgi:predicted nicotinamide N-methyase
MFELGAGTALASIVSIAVHGATVAVQELPHVLPFTLECLAMNNVQPDRAVAASWGADCVRLATAPTEPSSSSSEATLYDIVAMADVLYHVDDFQPLIDTILGSVEPEAGVVIIVYEQRRKDLSVFFKAISAHFLSNTRQLLQVTRVVDDQQEITTTFVIQQLTFRVTL